MDVVGEPVGAMHSTQHTDLRRPRQTAGHMARGRAITAPRDGSCRLARHPERADPSASFALPTGSATGFSALRCGRMLRSPFTLDRASVGDSLIALPRRREACWPKNGPGIRRSAESVARHSLAKESGRRVRTKTVIPLSRGSCVVQLDHQQRCKKEKAPAASNGAISFRAALGDNRQPV